GRQETDKGRGCCHHGPAVSHTGQKPRRCAGKACRSSPSGGGATAIATAGDQTVQSRQGKAARSQSTALQIEGATERAPIGRLMNAVSKSTGAKARGSA